MAQKSEFLDVDLFNMKPVPGEGMTQEPGLRAYERPPQITRVDEALSYCLKSVFSDASVKEKLFDAIDMGISVETVCSGLTLNAFTEGVFTPDVAELVKAPLIQFVTQAADRAGIEDINVTNEDMPKQKSTNDKLELMRSLNPRKFKRLREEEDNMEDMYLSEQNIGEEEEEFMPIDQGFINREDTREM